MARVLALGSPKWSDHRKTMSALRRVMEVYRDPYTLVCDMSDGAARYAAAGAQRLGWAVEPFEVDNTQCGPDCPDGHRKVGGPAGDFCPTARYRNTRLMFTKDIDLCLAFTRPAGDQRMKGNRQGQEEARRRGIALWEYEQITRRAE